MRNIVLVAHNLRSCHNVGSLLRTADGLGASQVYLTGYTPYPLQKDDKRMPYIAAKMHRQIQKTALGAEETANWAHNPDIFSVIGILRSKKYTIAALEQGNNSLDLTTWSPPSAVAIVLGRETEGIEQEVIDLCDVTLEIPMSGKKESFNVVQAAAMALYHCRFR